MEWMLMPYRRYADFQGRSCRREYWMFTLLSVIVAFGTVVLMASGGGLSANGEAAPSVLFWIGGAILVIWGLGSIIPSIAVQVRRFHDQERSGWMVLLGFIPYVGGLIVFIFMCLSGTRGPNRFGPDPLDPSNVDIFN
ncbi:DUF805 domain-containing protein [Novosphingobium sp.]|uniref:DUF805 domain-containing protein n=1 Tax=Novosphingobium sp. TaxID=1874826 RepID=UPI003BACBEAC